MRASNVIKLMTLRPHQKSLSEIAFECGYYDYSYLTNAIKRIEHAGVAKPLTEISKAGNIQ